MPQPLRILSIDGGGIRGIVPATVLAALEDEAGRPICELFDLIAGTSTGGILALALTVPAADDATRPRFTAEELVDLYVEEGPKIFDRSLLDRVRTVDGIADEKYRNDGLRDALDRYLGDARLRDTLVDVLVTAYDTAERAPFFFRTTRADPPGWDWPMASAALATATAPTYFEPVRLVTPDGSREFSLIDGGVFATNPAMCALAETLATGRGEDVVMVSLGTGQLTRPLPWAKVKDWGLLQWARPIIDVIFDGVADTVDFQARQILGDRYHRIQAKLVDGASDDLDDASQRNLKALRDLADGLVRNERAKIEELAGLLQG